MTGHVRQKSTSTIVGLRDCKGATKACSNGFTIYELMVVFIIIGLLSGLAYPKFIKSNAEAVLEGEAQRFLLDIRLAKQAANKTGFRHFIRVVSTSKIEVWRAKTSTDSGFSIARDTLVFQDSLDSRVQMGFAGITTKPSSFPPGHSNGTPSQADLTAGLSGFVSSSMSEDCWDNQPYPTLTGNTSGGWANKVGADYVIQVCGGPLADMTDGVMYLTTPKSPTRVYAITYNNTSIQAKLWYLNSTSGSWVQK